MFRKPKFKTCFRIEIVETEGVFLISERDTIVLQDSLYQLLCPLLDGSRTVDEIVQQLQDKLPVPYIYYALMELEQKGYLMEHQEVLPSNIAVFCEHLKVKTEDVSRRLQATTVTVKALGNLSVSELIATLESLQIQVVKEGDFEVVLTDDYLRPELVEINQKTWRDRVLGCRLNQSELLSGLDRYFILKKQVVGNACPNVCKVTAQLKDLSKDAIVFHHL